MSELSDESASDGAGLLQNDASESESSTGLETDDANGLLHIEAYESDDSEPHSSDDASDSESDSGGLSLGASSRRRPKAVFTQFKKLPIELRYRIWDFFCPDLHAPFPRVLSFQMLCSPKQDVIWEGPTLDSQIHPVHAMLCVHQESRQRALQAFPDTLAIRQGRRIIHFNKERDIVHLSGHRKPWGHTAFVQGFSEHVLHLAAEIPFNNVVDLQILTTFPNLVNFYNFEWHNKGRLPQWLRWCVSEKVHRYEILQLEKECRVNEDLHFIYCWPNIDKHWEFAMKHASGMQLVAEALAEFETMRESDEDLAETIDNDVLEKLQKINYWWMACFGWDAADRFPAFLVKYGDAPNDAPREGDDETEDASSSNEDDESDPNEYESDGIDDATIDEESVDEDEDDLLIDNRQESEDDEEGGASDIGGFSPLRNEDGNLLVDDDHSAAQLSSYEPETDGNSTRRRGRRAIVDSDDEDEGGEEDGVDAKEPAWGGRGAPVSISDDEDEAENPSQSAGRPRRVVLSDEEDEDEEESATKLSWTARRRARVLSSDDEDEGEEEGGADVSFTEDEGTKKQHSAAKRLQRNRRQDPVSDGEESGEEESSEVDDDAPPKSMSLAERLMAHREKNPIDSELEEDDSEGTIGDKYDLHENDEETEEESGMFIIMAEEGESEDNEQYEGEY